MVFHWVVEVGRETVQRFADSRLEAHNWVGIGSYTNPSSRSTFHSSQSGSCKLQGRQVLPGRSSPAHCSCRGDSGRIDALCSSQGHIAVSERERVSAREGGSEGGEVSWREGVREEE